MYPFKKRWNEMGYKFFRGGLGAGWRKRKRRVHAVTLLRKNTIAIDLLSEEKNTIAIDLLSEISASQKVLKLRSLLKFHKLYVE